jgi:hypothetical protein
MANVRQFSGAARILIDDVTGEQLIRLSAPIEADIINADLFAVTGGAGGNPGAGGKSLADLVTQLVTMAGTKTLADLLTRLNALPGISGNFLTSGQQTPAAGAAVAMTAIANVKKIVIAPLVNADGSKANTEVVWLRHSAADTTAGIPILPTDGKLVLYVSDATKIFVKTTHTGDGICFAAFDG